MEVWNAQTGKGPAIYRASLSVAPSVKDTAGYSLGTKTAKQLEQTYNPAPPEPKPGPPQPQSPYQQAMAVVQAHQGNGDFAVGLLDTLYQDKVSTVVPAVPRLADNFEAALYVSAFQTTAANPSLAYIFDGSNSEADILAGFAVAAGRRPVTDRGPRSGHDHGLGR